MKNENMADFIRELRKSQGMTQKQLAEQLNITDKAVSKWERGLSYPDITILSALAEILGVTVSELLSGKRDTLSQPAPRDDLIVQSTLEYADKAAAAKSKNIRMVLAFMLTFSGVIAALICVICNLVVSNRLTWSLYPVCSILFAWLVLMPLLCFEKNRMLMMLISLSIFIIPYLFALQQIIGGIQWILPLGIPAAIASLVYCWGVWALFAKTHLNGWAAAACALLLSIPLSLIINLIASRFTGDAYVDAWDGVSVLSSLIFAMLLYAIGACRNKKRD